MIRISPEPELEKGAIVGCFHQDTRLNQENYNNMNVQEVTYLINSSKAGRQIFHCKARLDLERNLIITGGNCPFTKCTVLEIGTIEFLDTKHAL